MVILTPGLTNRSQHLRILEGLDAHMQASGLDPSNKRLGARLAETHAHQRHIVGAICSRGPVTPTVAFALSQIFVIDLSMRCSMMQGA